jgi:hypothetical protein
MLHALVLQCQLDWSCNAKWSCVFFVSCELQFAVPPMHLYL